LNHLQHSKIVYKYFLLISLLGTFILLLLIQAPLKTVYTWQKLLIFSLFLLICFLGTIAGLYPSKCFKAGKFKQKMDYNSKSENKCQEIKFKGHHPICKNYRTHTFNFKGKTYCAGCSGMVTGATISIVSTIIYVFYGSIKDYNSIIFITGIILSLTALYLPLIINFKKNIYKFLINVFFVLGALFSLIGINSINSSLSIQLYFIVLILIWIVTRILISRETHQKICDECLLESCKVI